MIVRRTVRFRVRPSAPEEARLLETRRQYAEAFGAVVDAGWSEKRINAVQLHKATYHALRSRLSLPSQLVITARSKAVEALRAARRLKGGKPTMSNPSVRFDARCWHMDWDSCTARITVIGGRVELPFNIDPYTARFWGLRTTTADLVRLGKRWYLHVVTETEIADPAATGHVVGVDRGVRVPAVTSDGLSRCGRRAGPAPARLGRLGVEGKGPTGCSTGSCPHHPPTAKRAPYRSPAKKVVGTKPADGSCIDHQPCPVK